MLLDKFLITGASSGLGKNLSLYFAKKGHDLILTARDFNKLKEIKNFIVKEYKINCKIIAGDLGKIKDIGKIANFCIKNNVTAVINNAALLCSGEKLENISPLHIENMLKVNLHAPILLTRFLINYINCLININSIAGLEYKKQRTIYCTSKFGLKVFSNCLRLESSIKITDVYISKIKSNSEDYGLNPETIADNIYESYINNVNEIILDGRK